MCGYMGCLHGYMVHANITTAPFKTAAAAHDRLAVTPVRSTGLSPLMLTRHVLEYCPFNPASLQGQRVCLVAMGVDAVTNAVLAIGHARLYLEGDGMDIKAQPEFEKVDKDGEERTALRLHVICETVRS